ncbi:MAG: tRNA isopentenyl-2-thiomethyl-A-37 hydroxylase MiaE [Bradymonadaceae bacterium]
MYDLRVETSDEWVDCVLEQFDAFLADHAAAERKACTTAMHFTARYRDKPELIETMLEIAEDEIAHLREVFDVMRGRGLTIQPDEKNPYVNRLLEHAYSSGERRLLDRLLIGSIAEYRGCERFATLSRAMRRRGDAPDLADFYRELAADDSRHRARYWDMATLYFDEERVEERVDTWLDREAEVVRDLPVRPALH